MGKKNISSKFIRKKIVFVRKNLGENKVAVLRSKIFEKDVLPFETAKNESKDERRCAQKSEIKGIIENYSMTSEIVSEEKLNENNRPNRNQIGGEIKAKLPVNESDGNVVLNESSEANEKNSAIREKQILMDENIKPPKSESNNKNQANEMAFSINQKKRTKVKPYNYSGRNDEQKNLLINRNENTKNIKIKENSKRTHLEENEKNQNKCSEISSYISRDEIYTDEIDSESGLQEKKILKEKQIDEEELTRSIKHKNLKEISLKKIRMLFEKEEYSRLKEYSFPYMRLGQFCYRIYKIKLRNFRKLYFYCPVCGKKYKNYSIPFHIFQFHFTEREQYLTSREVAKACANLLEKEFKKIKHSIILFSQLSILYKAQKFRMVAEWAWKAENMINEIMELNIGKTYFKKNVENTIEELSLILPINKNKKKNSE